MPSAIRDENPVVFIEKRLIYERKGEVGGEDDLVPIGVAEVRRPGRDVTIVGVLHGAATSASRPRASLPATVSKPR